MFTKEKVLMAINNTNIHISIDWLYNQLSIVNSTKKKSNSFYEEVLSILDLICVLELRDVARSVYEEEEPDVNNNIDRYYLNLINEFEIDFKMLILYAGEAFFSSDYYEYYGEIGEYQVLEYLISKHFGNITYELEKHYSDNQTLLVELIKEQYFYNHYLEAVENVKEYEDCFDYVEAMKLTDWASSGFSSSGEA